MTFCAADRHVAFADADIVSQLIALLLRTGEERQFEILAYCFMPDHLHLLVEGLSPGSELLPFCTLLRQRLAHAYARRARRSLWQYGYWERVLRDDETTGAYVRYVLGNPVRMGLVRAVRDYAFSGGTWMDRMD